MTKKQFFIDSSQPTLLFPTMLSYTEPEYSQLSLYVAVTQQQNLPPKPDE